MRTLDFYLSKKFLAVLGFTLIAFISIYIIIDLIDHMRNFLSHNVPNNVIIMYYIFYLPHIIYLMVPVALLLSALMSVGELARNNEIVAMKSSGISLQRVLLPLFVIAFLISLFMIYFNERVVPFTNQKLFQIQREYLGKYKKLAKKRSNIYFKDPDNQNWVYINYYDSRNQQANRVSIQHIAQGTITSRYDAQRMVWEEKRWFLIDGTIRNINEENVFFEYFERCEAPPLIYTPDDFSKIQKKHEEMTYKELNDFIEEVKKNGGEPRSWLVDLYARIAFPFASFIIILFGAPLAAGKKRSGKALGFGISLFIAFTYFAIIQIGQTFGYNGLLPPLLAAWLGNIVFFTGSVIMLFKFK
ncbi:LPS export ABC transporter permease LptG [bacterium]|nr:LPS export ABC transporter permease LptG [bacterium]